MALTYADVINQLADIVSSGNRYEYPFDAQFAAFCMRVATTLPNDLPPAETGLIALRNHIQNRTAQYSAHLEFLRDVEQYTVPYFVSDEEMTFEAEKYKLNQIFEFDFDDRLDSQSILGANTWAQNIVTLYQVTYNKHAEALAKIIAAMEVMRDANNPEKKAMMPANVLALLAQIPSLIQAFGKIADGPGELFKKFKAEQATKKSDNSGRKE